MAGPLRGSRTVLARPPRAGAALDGITASPAPGAAWQQRRQQLWHAWTCVVVLTHVAWAPSAACQTETTTETATHLGNKEAHRCAYQRPRPSTPRPDSYVCV